MKAHPRVVLALILLGLSALACGVALPGGDADTPVPTLTRVPTLGAVATLTSVPPSPAALATATSAPPAAATATTGAGQPAASPTTAASPPGAGGGTAVPSPAPTLQTMATAPATGVPPGGQPGGQPIVVARHEAAGTFAIAHLDNIPLMAGHRYRLEVSSRAGTVNFSGSYNNTSSGGVDVQLIQGATPMASPIAPPGGDSTNWTYSVSVQNQGDGGIIVTIFDVTGAP